MNVSGIRPRPGFYESWPGYFDSKEKEKENIIYMTDKDWKKSDFDPKAAAEARKKELDDMTAKIEKGVTDCFNSEDYRKLITVMAKMPHYSVNNQILIMLQNPEATLCNSFSGWKKVGRFVKAGEKGLRILAPAPYQIDKEREKMDAQGNVIRDKDGEPVTETVKVTVNAFKPVSTFDLAQTDGEPLPQLGVDELLGTVDGYETLMKAITDASPVPISFENIESGAKGFYHQTEKRIAIQEGMSQAQTVKTALHEVAHATYHNLEAVKDSGEKKSKAQKECEAESIAMICAAHFGIDTSDYSIPYLTGWSSGAEMPELKASLQTIRAGACEIIDSVEKEVRSLTYDRVEANRAPDDFMSVIEGMETPFDEPLPFGKGEVDLPAGFIKIEPPFDASNISADKKITLSAEKADEKKITPDDAEKGKKNSTQEKEESGKKSSVKKKLEASKEKVAKTPKPKKTAGKNLQEAI